MTREKKKTPLVTHTMAVSPVLHGTGSTQCTSSVMMSVPLGKFNKVAKTEFKRTMVFAKTFYDSLSNILWRNYQCVILLDDLEKLLQKYFHFHVRVLLLSENLQLVTTCIYVCYTYIRLWALQHHFLRMNQGHTVQSRRRAKKHKRWPSTILY